MFNFLFRLIEAPISLWFRGTFPLTHTRRVGLCVGAFAACWREWSVPRIPFFFLIFIFFYSMKGLDLVVRFSIGERVSRLTPHGVLYQGRIVGICGMIDPLHGIAYAISKYDDPDEEYELLPKEFLKSEDCEGFEVKFNPAEELKNSFNQIVIYGDLVRFTSHISTQFVVHKRECWSPTKDEMWTVSVIECGYELSPKCRSKTKNEAIQKAEILLKDIPLDKFSEAIDTKPVINKVNRTLKGLRVAI